MRKYIFITFLLALFCIPTALAESYSFSSIHASLELPTDTYDVVLTPENLSQNLDWLSQNSIDPDALSATFEADGVLMRAYDLENNRTFVLTALNDVDAQMNFDLNQQDSDMRRDYRVGHTDGTAYGILGYTYHSASWKNYGGNVLRFLQTRYTLKENDTVIRYGYQRRTIRNGYTITLDMQVTGRTLKDADQKALEKIMSSFAFTEILPMPELPIKLSITSAPPEATNSGTFTIKGTSASRAQITVTAVTLNSSSSTVFTDTANGSGSFSVKVTLPTAGVYTIIIKADAEGSISAQRTFSVTFQKGMIPTTLTESPNAELTDETHVAGSTESGARTQLIVTGPSGISYNKTTTSRNFTFKVDTSTEGTYSFSLTIAKRNLDTKVFTFTGVRTKTEAERTQNMRASASSPSYATLKNNLSSYQGRIIEFTGYISSIEANTAANEWTLTIATRKNANGYRDLIYVIANEAPAFGMDASVHVYGTVTGEFTTAETKTVYPRCTLILMEGR